MSVRLLKGVGCREGGEWRLFFDLLAALVMARREPVHRRRMLGSSIVNRFQAMVESVGKTMSGLNNEPM